jgi:hypothetical protein
MEKRLTGELVKVRDDMAKMMAIMEAREVRAEKAAATAAKTAAAMPQQSPQFQYPPLGVNGYHTNYHPPASPGYNYQTMYQGYPTGYGTQPPYNSPPQNWNQQQIANREAESARAYDMTVAGVPRDLNKRSHNNSPSFNDTTTDRTKRKDQRETPSKDVAMEEQNAPADPNWRPPPGNPYNRDPRTPTQVSPPSHIHRGLYPLEWNKGRPGDPRRRNSPPPQQNGPQYNGNYYKPNESHPAEDARHFRV